MRRSLLIMAAAGAAATFALAPSASLATSNGKQQGAVHLLSVANANAVAVQPDGKVVAGGYRAGAGWSQDPAEAPDFALARYKPNGLLDASFGKGGRITTDFGSSSE